MNDHKVFEMGNLRLQCGMILPNAQLTYQTYGKLAADKSNVVLYPTSYGAHHMDIEWLIGLGRILDLFRIELNKSHIPQFIWSCHHKNSSPGCSPGQIVANNQVIINTIKPDYRSTIATI